MATKLMVEATVIAVDQGLAGGALAGSGALILSLVKLVAELHGSKAMCQDLVENLKAVQLQLELMLSNENIKTSQGALESYQELLKRVRDFFQDHVDANLWMRVINHWKMKEQVQKFYVDLKWIKSLLGLQFQEESANRHGEITEMLYQHKKLEEQTQKALNQDLKDLELKMKSVPNEVVAALGANTIVTVADLKHELKIHHDMYSKKQYQQLKSIWKHATALVPDTHQPRWYLSRSDFRFDERSPFATKQFRSIHHGTLVSGTEVTIKTVMAEIGDEKAVKAFHQEVETWYALKDPHVLPLYGANALGYPLLFVCGRAELGNFNDYLRTRPHRFWQMFLDITRGLAYLHKQKCVHGNLKCNNLLVTKYGVGVLSDFGFSFVRENSALSLKEQTPDYFWKAPECFSLTDPTPRFESDVYSLGMCIFEAMSGTLPFVGLEERDATSKIMHGELPPRPEGKITEEAWNLITRMCCRNYQERVGLTIVIAKMQFLAAQEELRCSKLSCRCPAGYCIECGGLRGFKTIALPEAERPRTTDNTTAA